MKIRLGYEEGTGKPVEIKPAHIMVTGITQESGKTTTLESMAKAYIKADKSAKVVVFRTKLGERSFTDGHHHKPFFRDRSDWKFVEELLEATMNEKMKFERAMIIRLSKGTRGLDELKSKIDDDLENKKMNAFNKDILTKLQAYLEIVLPKLRAMDLTTTMNLKNGMNIFDLEHLSGDIEVQSLIIRSVLEQVMYEKNTITIIPEARKFIPQRMGNPCKMAVLNLITQGASNDNFVWIDSQDITSVDKQPLKQITTYLLGYQAEPNEVKKTLNHMPLSPDKKPKANEIMNLGTGFFYIANRDLKAKVFIHGWWYTENEAHSVATGKMSIEELPEKPKSEEKIEIKTSLPDHAEIGHDEIETKLHEIKTDLDMTKKSLLKRIDELEFEVGNINERNEKECGIDSESIVKQVLSRLNTDSDGLVFQVEPLEMLTKHYLVDSKNKIISDINELSRDAKKMLGFLEAYGISSISDIIIKCFHRSMGNQSARNKVAKLGSELNKKSFLAKRKRGDYESNLHDRIKEMLEGLSDDENEVNLLHKYAVNELLTNLENDR